jgi:DNA mismatch repair protein MSH6
MCRPVIREPSDKPYLAVEEARHPCLALTGLNFVPNNISLGGDDPRFLLLTGPNMGGKSTTLRMVCVLAILA